MDAQKIVDIAATNGVLFSYRQNRYLYVNKIIFIQFCSLTEKT